MHAARWLGVLSANATNISCLADATPECAWIGAMATNECKASTEHPNGTRAQSSNSSLCIKACKRRCGHPCASAALFVGAGLHGTEQTVPGITSERLGRQTVWTARTCLPGTRKQPTHLCSWGGCRATVCASNFVLHASRHCQPLRVDTQLCLAQNAGSCILLSDQRTTLAGRR